MDREAATPLGTNGGKPRKHIEAGIWSSILLMSMRASVWARR